jgi:hypothetical protein
MPNVGSWDGKWSGEEVLYARVRPYRGKTAMERAKALDGKSYHYSWGDGWGASVDVREVTASEAAKIRKKSRGFCGYDWMIDSIEARDKILADHEVQS